MNRNYLSGRKVLVMGLGRFGGGVDAAKFAFSSGAKVKVTDISSGDKLGESLDELKGLAIEYRLGSHEKQDFLDADIVVVNPAVPPENEFVVIARDNSKIVTSAMNIFFQLCLARIIGITGSNGKSTTTALTGHILTRCAARSTQYANVWIGGNIGNMPLLQRLEDIGADDLVVLELSSFQLENLAQIKKSAFCALITNLSPNHLDRHGTFENYCATKENLFHYQSMSCVSIFNAEDKICCDWFDKYSREQGRVCIKYHPDMVSEKIKKKFPLPGRANLSNLAAAVTIARYFGVKEELVSEAVQDFKGLPHRLEFVREVNGVRWYNDSIATTPESVMVALDAFEEGKILIAGGYDKKIAFDNLGERIVQLSKAVVLIGQTAGQIADSIKKANADFSIHLCKSLAEAVNVAGGIARSGDIVLLSPACASYDMFDNFQQRGEQFRSLVNQLK
ncbi:MAG: UDP-N-acetylmuramoyl-L-alanine--D-glutamate ligase [Phycisphaerae bacterium]|nr:UDP-N-acetylmuramoyl-L-alanine--D-glutamate ligase [Phycisphaerae bacterium]